MELHIGDLPKRMANISLKPKIFPFFDLPFELRSKVLCYILTTSQPVDLDPSNYRSGHQRLNLFLTSHRLHSEASHLFYSTHTFRIFPTHGRFFGHRTKPLLQRFPTRYRESLTSLELRLGPGWNNPPKSWWVDSRLGLEEMAKVRTLKVFVECDPSHEIFRGFRIGRDFFTDFSAHLLEEITRRLPALVWIEFDGWPSVMREGPLMKKLVEVAKESGKKLNEIAEASENQVAEIREVQSSQRHVTHLSRPRNVEPA